MFRWQQYVILIFCFQLCLCWNTPAWAADDSDIVWHELESEHFVIHYPITREVFARRALGIAEEAYKQLIHHLKWVPKTKTHLSVTDNLDEANGWARSTPRNEIKLYAWPPEISEELGFYDDWMRQLIYHEYTHILHTDTSSGLHPVLNAIFGKFARNNSATPRWYTEGLAVYYESLLSQSGRLRNAIYRIMLRNAAISKKIPTLGELSTGLTEWPGGTASYLYGAYFISYLAKTYGRDKLTQWNFEYGNDWIPYAMNRAAIQIFGKTWDDLYEEWRQSVYINTDKMIKHALADVPLTPSHTWISPWRHERPRIIPHQNAISYVRNNGNHLRAIVKHDLNTHEETVLTQCWGRCEHHWTDDGQNLIFSFAKAHDGYKQHETLYRFNLETQKITPLNLSGRIRAFDIDGNDIYRVVQKNESIEIYRNTIPETQDILIYQGLPFEQIDEIAVQNEKILAVRFDPQKQYSDIYIFQNNEWMPLTNDKNIDISPYWRHDGRIGYVSTASGEMNLWSMDIHGNDKQRHTHLLNGILHVAESPNGDIYYTTYTPQGTTIGLTYSRELKNHPMHNAPLGFIFDEIPKNESQPHSIHSDIHLQTLENGNSSRPYRPWQWLWPQTWTPKLAWNETDGIRLGLSFQGNDFAEHHQYAFQLEYLTRKNAVDFSFSYVWTGLLWDLGLSTALIQGTGHYHNTKRLTPYDYQVVTADFWANRVWNMMTSSHQLNLGFHLEYRETLSSLRWPSIDPAAPPPSFPALGWMNAITLNWTWSNMRQTEKNMVASSGYTVSANIRFEAPWIGAQSYTISGKITGNAAWTMPWLEGHTVNATLAAGGSWSQNAQRQPFTLTTSKGLSFNTADVALHGYPVGLLFGQHFLYAKASYTALLWDGQAGYSTLPIGFSRLGANLFGEWGYTWSGHEFHILHSKYALGAKIYIDLSAGYRLPVRLTLGYAWGGAPHGGHQGFVLLDL